MKEKLIELYLEWFNDFLTIQKMADWHGIEVEDMQILIELGKKYHEQTY